MTPTLPTWAIILIFGLEATCWLTAYFLIIRIGFKEKTYGMPVVAMCGNIAWEWLFGLGILDACPILWAACQDRAVDLFMHAGTLGAGLLDVAILVTILKFGADQFKAPGLKRYFTPLVLGGIALAAGLVYTIESEFYTYTPAAAATNVNPNVCHVTGHFGLALTLAAQAAGLNPTGAAQAATPYLLACRQGGMYSGFGLALMMGILFIAFLLARDGLAGQSLFIALGMAFGNVFAYLFSVAVADGYVAPLLHVLGFASLFFNFLYAYMLYQKARATGSNPWKLT